MTSGLPRANFDAIRLRCWDAVVIGAGPAGSIAAGCAARLGLDVLLVEKRAFPRDKVCGCCVNAAARQLLQQEGFGDPAVDLNAPRLTGFRLIAGEQSVSLSIPQGAAVSRARLDEHLVERAVTAGVAFLDGAAAQVGGANADRRLVSITKNGQTADLAARVVIVADGLAGRSLKALDDFTPVVSRASRIGAAVMLDNEQTSDSGAAICAPGEIVMACGRGGYVGLVVVEDGRLNVAAAVDVLLVRECRGLAGAVQHVLHSAGIPAIGGMSDARWIGTPPLTQRRRRAAGERLFVIGDAAGYVEPFTGEGMAWATATAAAVAPIAAEAVRNWHAASASAWTGRYRRLLARRQRYCRWLAHLLRHPSLVRMTVQTLNLWPALTRPYLRELAAPAIVS